MYKIGLLSRIGSIEKYSKYIHDGGKTDKDSLKPFVINFIRSWIKDRGPGHYKFINDIMFILFSNDLKNIDDKNKSKFIESDFTIDYITDYIVAVLEKFTYFREDDTLNLREYFQLTVHFVLVSQLNAAQFVQPPQALQASYLMPTYLLHAHQC